VPTFPPPNPPRSRTPSAPNPLPSPAKPRSPPLPSPHLPTWQPTLRAIRARSALLEPEAEAPGPVRQRHSLQTPHPHEAACALNAQHTSVPAINSASPPFPFHLSSFIFHVSRLPAFILPILPIHVPVFRPSTRDSSLASLPPPCHNSRQFLWRGRGGLCGAAGRLLSTSPRPIRARSGSARAGDTKAPSPNSPPARRCVCFQSTTPSMPAISSTSPPPSCPSMFPASLFPLPPFSGALVLCVSPPSCLSI